MALVARASSQQQLNELQLCNGGDGFFSYGDPSNGTAYLWKVIPKEVLRAADGAGPHTMQLSGLTMMLFDTAWATPPSFYDVLIVRGQPSGLPDNVGPDLNDPNGELVQLGSASSMGISDPCALPGNPLGCIGGCPPLGMLVGYEAEISFGVGTLVTADGQTDLAIVSFVPGGMTWVSGPPGPCGQGDYTFCDFHSSNQFGTTPGEKQAPTASGNSPYGGFFLGGALVADGLDEVQDLPVEFQQPVIEGRTTLDPPATPLARATGLGLSSLRFSVGAGANGYGVKMLAASHVGDLGFVVATTAPQLPYPGQPLLGVDVLVSLADPLASASSTVWNGTLALLSGGGPPFDDGVLTLPTLTVPAAAVGASLSLQGFTFDASTFTFDCTGTFKAAMLP